MIYKFITKYYIKYSELHSIATFLIIHVTINDNTTNVTKDLKQCFLAQTSFILSFDCA